MQVLVMCTYSHIDTHFSEVIYSYYGWQRIKLLILCQNHAKVQKKKVNLFGIKAQQEYCFQDLFKATFKQLSQHPAAHTVILKRHQNPPKHCVWKHKLI